MSRKHPTVGKRDTLNVQPDKYYIWTWRPKEYWHLSGIKANYKKQYCAQPFYTRYHAKKTAVLHFGVDALADIRVISGRSLIKQGITQFPQTKLRLKAFIKGVPRGVPPWIMSPEHRFDKFVRKDFRRAMARAAKMGRKAFNYFYAMSLYGYTQLLDKKYLAAKRRKVEYEILCDLQKTGDI